MTNMRCLVVDDEPLAIDIVTGYLRQLGVTAILTAGNAVEAFRLLQQQPVDLLFLDIRMPQLTGFDLLKSLPHRPLVVLTTAYRDFAVEGFEWEVLDYLVKPFSFPRFLRTMEKAGRALQSSASAAIPAVGQPQPDEKDSIFLKTDRHWIRIPIDAILYIESLKDYIRVFTTGTYYICHQPLTEITARLPPEKFFRVHRSYTLALDKIDHVRQHCAYIGTTAIPVSRAHRQELYRQLGR